MIAGGRLSETQGFRIFQSTAIDENGSLQIMCVVCGFLKTCKFEADDVEKFLDARRMMRFGKAVPWILIVLGTIAPVTSCENIQGLELRFF